MLGIILISISSLFHEVGASIGKRKIEKKEESIYAMAFLSYFWSSFWFLGVMIFRHDFVFSLASLPTFLTRAVLEIILTNISITALVRADRTTFGFVRTSTVVMLLLVDLALGYSVSITQMAGMAIISLTLLIVFMNHGINKTGLNFVILSAIGAVATISLFKYDISHFNSVEAEQLLMNIILMAYFSRIAMKGGEHPIKMMAKPIFFGQSFADGLGTVFGSFAYNFAPASVIAAGGRSTSAFFSILSGNIYFHEKNVLMRLVIFLMLAVGIFLLI
jgi:drug/metabolite transporter (DMT)-like permease